MKSVAINPARVHALVVGIEAYEAGDSWNLDGPAKDGLKFVDWLLSKDVLPRHIRFFVSPLAKNEDVLSRAKDKRVISAPATRDNIDKYINENLLSDEAGGDLLYVFWGGHGAISTALGDNRQLRFADFTEASYRSLAIDTLVEALQSARNHNEVFKKQIFFVDACANLDLSDSNEAIKSAVSATRYVRSSSSESAEEQHVLFSAAKYKIAPNDSAEGTGIFSKLVLRSLEGQTLWPDITIINKLVAKDKRISPATYYYEGPEHEYSQKREPSTYYSTESRGLPLPNAGILQRPVSQPAFLLNSPDASQNSPLQRVKFSLEAFLGFERKGFLAIVAGFEDDSIFNSLRAIEYELKVNIEQRTEYTAPTRWWIRINLDELTAFPRELSDVWQNIADEDEIKEYLIYQGIPDFVVLGIIIEVDSKALEPDLLQNICDWCTKLTNKISNSLSTAIIIDLHFCVGSTIEKISEVVETVEKSLIDFSDVITKDSVIKVILNETCKYISQPCFQKFSLLSENSKSEAKEFHIYSWFLDALRKGLLDISNAALDYSEIFCVYNEYLINGIDDFFVAASARQLLDSIDTYASLITREKNSELANLYRHFLELARRDSPSKLHTLLTAYASSCHTEAYRQAFCFTSTCNNFYSNILVDIFFDGISSKSAQEKFVKSFETSEDEWWIANKPFVDKLGLALLRQLDKGKDFRNLIVRIRPILSKDVQSVVDFYFQEDNSAKNIYHRINSNHIVLVDLINSGVKAAPLLEILKNSQYSNKASYIWLLSVCLLTYTEYLEELLNVEQEFLVLWGLNQSQESPLFDKESYELLLLYWRNYLPFIVPVR